MNELSTNAITAQIIDEYESSTKYAHKAIECSIRIGELLILAKDGFQHGTWISWIEENFEFGPRMANKYMRLAENKTKILSNKNSEFSFGNIDEALKQIANHRPTIEPTVSNAMPVPVINIGRTNNPIPLSRPGFSKPARPLEREYVNDHIGEATAMVEDDDAPGQMTIEVPEEAPAPDRWANDVTCSPPSPPRRSPLGDPDFVHVKLLSYMPSEFARGIEKLQFAIRDASCSDWTICSKQDARVHVGSLLDLIDIS